MTSANAAVARAWELVDPIYRQPEGWRSPVTVQEWDPNIPRYSWANMGPVDHCGLSCNHVDHSIGLTMGVDFPDSAWTPSGYAWFRATGRTVALWEIQSGDTVYFSNSGSINDITHVEKAVEDVRSDGGVLCVGWNTTPAGTGVPRVRYGPYMVAAGRPAYREPEPEPKPEPTPPPTVSRAQRVLAAIA
jgi:hypothetical protein